MMISDNEVTELLQSWNRGDASALEKLMRLVFEDLRNIAARLFRRENEGHTLQPTALVNEMYLRLIDQRQVNWQNREQFFGVAALLMRRILVDYAKGRHAVKRGSGSPKIPLDEALGVPGKRMETNIVAIDEALLELAKIDRRQSQIVELHYFMGLNHEEIAEVLKISVTTVKREFKTAKLWLYRELTKK